jgi:hypothetical protein
MGITSSKGCTGPWDPQDTRTVHYDITGCPDFPKVYNEVVWGDSQDITFGDYNEVCLGAYNDITAGVLLEIVLGPMLEICVGGSFEMAGMPAALWQMSGVPLDSEKRYAGQYDIVFGTYYETLYDGDMYYWEPADSEAFEVFEAFTASGQRLDSLLVHGSQSEVVGSKVVRATGPGGIRYIAGNAAASGTPTVTAVGESVVMTAATAATLVVSEGDLQLSGADVSLSAPGAGQVITPGAGFSVSDLLGFYTGCTGALELNSTNNEWGQPGVEMPPLPPGALVVAVPEPVVPDEPVPEVEPDPGFGLPPGLEG